MLALIYKYIMDITTGRIFFGQCYYDVQTGDITHDAGPFSDNSCNHGFDDDIVVPQDQIDKATIGLNKLNTEAELANEHIFRIMEDPNMFNNGEFDITNYINLWRFLEIPQYLRKDFNLYVSTYDNKVLLCQRDQSKDSMLMKKGYACKYC